MFERFTAEARDAVHVAQVEAAGLHAPAVGCGHLLLGCAATNGLATAALGACGVDLASLRSAVSDATDAARSCSIRSRPSKTPRASTCRSIDARRWWPSRRSTAS